MKYFSNIDENVKGKPKSSSKFQQRQNWKFPKLLKLRKLSFTAEEVDTGNH